VTSVLLVAQLSPPSPLIAARRVAAMAKYLARQGLEITVLTSRVSGEEPIAGASEVVRTHDLLTTPLNWRRRHFSSLAGQTGGSYRRASRLQSLLVPDPAAVTWLPFALPAALRLARRKHFDCVITTSPPQSAHVIGYVLRRRTARCWLAELRDGWTFEPPRPEWPLGVQRRLDRRLERRLLGSADAVVAVTEPIAADARERLGVEAHVITNGFDAEEPAGPAPNDLADDLLSPDRISFVHTGRIGVTGRRLAPLLEALGRLQRETPELADRFEVVFAGPVSEAEAGELGEFGPPGLVRVVGAFERGRVLRLQRAADCLLVLTRGARSEATGKLFEYLAADRPIIVLGEGTEAARIVTDTGRGTVVPADDPRAIAGALQRAVEGDWPTPVDCDDVSRYSWQALGAEYAALLEHVCGSSTS
jgi:glycosyltransferase involved in cell wall biosynthesis